MKLRSSKDSLLLIFNIFIEKKRMKIILDNLIWMFLYVGQVASITTTTSCNFTRFGGNVHQFVRRCDNHCTILTNFNKIQRVTLKLDFKSVAESQKVEALKFAHNNIHFIPEGIDTYFPKLKALIFYRAGLKKITSDDFKNLTNLEFLNLNCNQIVVLGENLFKFNPNLSHVFMIQNKIKSINPTAFYGLTLLSTVDLTYNTCCNHSAFNQSDVNLLLKSIKQSCWNDTENNLEAMANTTLTESTNQNIEFKKLFNRFVNRTANPVEIITIVNSGVLIILIISLILYCICRWKSQKKPARKQIKIDHTTHEEFSSQNVNDYREEPNAVKVEDEINKEELYSDIETVNLNKKDQVRGLMVDDAVIYAEVNKSMS
ncbi:hypothetical protein ACKWTF_014154 [Chironomus riparius]